MSKHTPGPWENYYWLVRHPIGGVDEDGVPFTEVVATASNEANARLIAAAPALLAACRVALEYFADTAGEWFDTERDLADQLRAAIALAEEGHE